MSEVWGCGSVFWQAHTASLDGEELLRVEEVEAAVVVVKKPDGRVELLAHGNPQLLPHVLDNARISGIPAPTWAMLTRGIPLTKELRAWLPPNWGNLWDYYWTREPLAPHPWARDVHRITAQDARPIVTVANPLSEAFEDFEGYRWYGLTSDGTLASVLGAKDEPTGAVYIGGLGTLPEYRGRGFGGAIMTGVTANELQTHHLLNFGMWAENPARTLYESLGYVHGGAQIIADSEPFGPH
ncbi:MAG: GNAT family N-acetyltransferase [Ancrocorticia sp.]|uniref:GNAT family N-acetyltransferase n=1 Tax=Ancrocorticia sp. TaxID=2593684 RepID=UPI003F8EA2B4